MNDQDKVLDGVRALLRLVGQDPDREDLADTPQRFLKAYLELCAQPGNPAELLARTFPETSEEMIVVGPIEFTSVCEHHLLPFSGTAWVGYLPQERVVGLSKIPRLVQHYAKRPQVQERLTKQVVEAIMEHLEPLGAGCVIRSAHSCMSLRGVKASGAQMVTSALRGPFRDDPAVRAEFLALTKH